MAWVTEEEYQAAKQVRAYEYLQTYQPGRLKKHGQEMNGSFRTMTVSKSMRLPANGIGSPGVLVECRLSGFDAGRWHGIYGSSKNLV